MSFNVLSCLGLEGGKRVFYGIDEKAKELSETFEESKAVRHIRYELIPRLA